MVITEVFPIIFFLSAVGIVGALIFREPAAVYALVEPEVDELPLAA
jgi:hypothetical protein